MGDVRTMAGQNVDAEQEVLTPPSVIAIVEDLFQGPIALDPCAPSHTPPIFKAERYVTIEEDGLSIEWVNKTYVNPPYNDLRPWLSKAMETAKSGHKVILLVPVRTWRKWFYEAMADCDHIVWLPPVAFAGHKQAFPFPLCLLCWNCGPRGFDSWRSLDG